MYSTLPQNKLILISEIVTIIDESDCGPTTCSIMAKGCASTSPTPYISTSGSTPNFILTLDRNIQAGYGPEEICIKCSSSN